MARAHYVSVMQQRMSDMDFKIQQARNRLVDEHLGEQRRFQLAGELDRVEARRREIGDRLDGMRTEPECTWDRCRHELDRQWDALAQDFEERISRLT